MLINFATALICSFIFACLAFPPHYLAPYIGDASKKTVVIFGEVNLVARLGQSINAPAMEHSSTLADKRVRPVAPMDYTFIGKTGGVWMKQEAPMSSALG